MPLMDALEKYREKVTDEQYSQVPNAPVQIAGNVHKIKHSHGTKF